MVSEDNGSNIWLFNKMMETLELEYNYISQIYKSNNIPSKMIQFVTDDVIGTNSNSKSNNSNSKSNIMRVAIIRAAIIREAIITIIIQL